jgi:hypothetical protein
MHTDPPCGGLGRKLPRSLLLGALACLVTPVFVSPASAAPSPALQAANKLLAMPWSGLSRQAEQDAEAAFRALGNTDLIDTGTQRDGRWVRWRFRQWLANPTADLDIAAPPGFQAVSPQLDHFTMEMPLASSWGLKISADLKNELAAWYKDSPKKTRVTWSPSLHFGLRISDCKIIASARLDNTQRDRPTLVSANITSRLTVGGSGTIPIAIPVSLTTTFAHGGGGLTLRGPIDFPLNGMEALQARLKGELVLTFTPKRAEDAEGIEATTMVVGQQMRVSLRGNVRFTWKEKLPHAPSWVPDINLVGVEVPFSFTTPHVDLPPLAVGENDLLTALAAFQGPLPRPWGEDHPLGLGKTPAPPIGTDYVTPANAIEGAIVSHMPHGAVLSIDRTLIRTGPVTREQLSYGKEADSAIFTGHYLAAEAFRDAATGSSDARARVKSAVAGIKRLFEVTQDAAVSGTRPPFPGAPRGAPRVPNRVPVQVRGIFARTALPSTSLIGFTGAPLESRGCYYEAPEGGWQVTGPGGSLQHYPTYGAIPAARRQISLGITPVGPVWYGWGCGDDHPVSRDAYSGVFMGLAYTYALVPDPEVQATVRGLIEQALDTLISNKWNVVLPPDNRIAATSSFIGNFDKQLAFLRIGKSVNPTKYGPLYDEVAAAAEVMWLPAWFSALDPIPDYYKFNLLHAVLGPALFLEGDPALRAHYMTAYNVVRRATGHHRNAYFNLMRILVEPPAQRALTAASPSASNPEISLREEIQSILAEWLERRTRVASVSGLPLNLVAAPPYQASLWPQNVALYTSTHLSRSYQARYALPVWGRIGRGMDFMWERSPFDVGFKFHDPSRPECTVMPPTAGQILECGSAPRREGPGVDYLLAYWLGAYLEVLPK